MTDYERIAEAINYITLHINEQPSLDDVARHLDLSPHHFQKLFTRWAGVSPKRFLQTLTVRHAKQLLDESLPLLEAANDLGLSSTARLHDHFVTLEAITPGEYKTNGKGLEISYGMHQTPFGSAFIAVTERGICQLSFTDNHQDKFQLITELEQKWCSAKILEAKKITQDYVSSIFITKKQEPVSLIVKGTNFQVNVWKALLGIPYGKLATYGQLAKNIGKPNASRAVGSAVGANPIAFLIPCHRVIRNTGIIGEYRWGNLRKRAMLCTEALNT